MPSESKMQPASETGSRQRLEIRVRRTMAADGSESTQYSVFCPVRGCSLPLSDCRVCELCGGATVDPLEQNSFVLCASEPRSPMAWQVPSLRPRARPGDSTRPGVAAIMTKNVLCVRPEVSIQELTMTLFEHGVSGVPVVDAEGKPIGIVSKTDLLRENYDRAELEQEEAVLRSGRVRSWGVADSPGLPAAHAPKSTVGEIMTHSVSSLPESASVHEAAALMALEGVRRLPILDHDDRVVGIVCASDVLTWLAREAGYVVPSRFPQKWRQP